MISVHNVVWFYIEIVTHCPFICLICGELKYNWIWKPEHLSAPPTTVSAPFVCVSGAANESGGGSDVPACGEPQEALWKRTQWVRGDKVRYNVFGLSINFWQRKTYFFSHRNKYFHTKLVVLVSLTQHSERLKVSGWLKNHKLFQDH